MRGVSKTSAKTKDNGGKHAAGRGKKIFLLGMVFLMIFLVIVGVSVYMVWAFLGKRQVLLYQRQINETAQEISSWFIYNSQIVAEQKAAIEINDNYDSDYLQSYMDSVAAGYDEEHTISDIYFLSTEGELAAASHYAVTPDDDLRSRLWYVNAVEKEGICYVTPYQMKTSDDYVITISTAIHDSNGRLRGVLAVDISADTLIDYVNCRELAENSYYFLLDRDLKIITHPNEGYRYENGQPMSIYSIKGEPYEELADELSGSSDKEFIAAKPDYDGKTRVLFTDTVIGCDWYLVGAVDSALFFKVLAVMVTMLVLLFSVFTAGAVILTNMYARRLIRALNTATEAANEANETKSTFLANMSHEIRTPINAVIGMNEMILRENTDPTINDYALDIASASRSLTAIINDVLDFSKIESGKLEIVENEFNIASLINDIVNMSMSRLGEKDLEIFVNADPSVPAGLIGDEMRIRQIVINMMTNGIKYTREGHVTLTVTCTKQSYGINLDISVRDTGIGITEENLEKLFQSFSQVDTKRNRSIEGTGLGLAITKRLVTQMGGFINVRSQYGLGSEFSVTIPLRVSDPQPFISIKEPEKIHAAMLFTLDHLSMRTASECISIMIQTSNMLGIDTKLCSDINMLRGYADEGLTHIFTDRKNYLENKEYFNSIAHRTVITVVQGRSNSVKLPENVRCIYKPFYSVSAAAVINNDHTEGMFNDRRKAARAFTAPAARILIVDDNPVNLKVAAGLMKPYQMNITTVDSGQKALDTIKDRHDFNIVFMDHMMPEMDGVECTAQIRKLPGEYFRTVPIIALTANTVNNSRQMFLSSGFDDFLAKPIDISMLDRLLRKYIPRELRNKTVQEEIVSEPAETIAGDRRHHEAPPVEQKQEASAQVLFDPELGISYTAGDKELYLEILTEYARQGEEMRSILTQTFEGRDWKNYVIKVHALKSTSLNIGAKTLSELAKKLELTGKAGEYEPILAEHDTLMGMYADVLAQTLAYLKENGREISPVVQEEPSAQMEEISPEELVSLIDSFKEACDSFDGTLAGEIAGRAAGRSVKGVPIGKAFAAAGKMAEECDYDMAAEEAEKLRSLAGGA